MSADVAAAPTARCARPEGPPDAGAICNRPLSQPVLDGGARGFLCSRHGVVTDVRWSDRPRDIRWRGRTGITGRRWDTRLGDDVDAAIDARAERDGLEPTEALRVMLREKVTADARRRVPRQ